MGRKTKKKASSTPVEPTVDTDEQCEVPDDLSVISLYHMIVNLSKTQKKFYDDITALYKNLFDKFKEITIEQSNNWTDYMDKTWENISSGLVMFCDKLESLEKKCQKLNSNDSSDKKLVVKGVPEDIADDESLKKYVQTVFAALDDEIKDFKIERINVNSKPGPVCIHFKAEEDLMRILKKKRCLKDSEEFRTVFISPWMSKQERKTDFNIRQLVKVSSRARYIGGRVLIKT